MTIDTRKLRYVLAVLLAAIVAVGAYAFTNSNTVPASHAGSGSGAISGYTVSNISYTPDATTPTNLDAVSFTLDAAAKTVKAQVDSVAGTWYACTNTSGNSWSCDTTVGTPATVKPTDQLTVVATD